MWGEACDIAALEDIARRRRLTLLFDAAHALGCTAGGRPVGGFGAAEVFSLHATKVANAAEGGLVTTDDPLLASRLRLARNFGFAGQDRVVGLGINGKMSELAAAMGLTSLESLDEFVAVNRRNHGLYREHLAGVPGITVRRPDPAERHNFQYVALEVDAELAGIDRDGLRDVLWAENVLARRYFYPGVHRMEPYCSRDPEAWRGLPHTERLADCVLCLPTGTAVTPEATATIGAIVRLAVAHGPEVARRLTASRGPAGRGGRQP